MGGCRFSEWLKETRRDIVCLQELKTSDEKFPAATIEEAGYHALWHGQKSYNGVAILSRGAPIIERRRGLPGNEADDHARYIEAEIGELVVGCLYLPNGNPAPGPKFDYKLAWFQRLIDHANTLIAEGCPAILCGDFNVVPTDMDAVVPERWRWDAVMFEESRAAYAQLLAQGWSDAIRETHDGKGPYTYWNFAYRGGYDRSSGLRLDHFLISPAARERLAGAGVDQHVRGWPKPSDHAPVWIELR